MFRRLRRRGLGENRRVIACGGKLLHEAAKAELLEQDQRPATVGAVQPRRPPIDRQRGVGVQLHELAAQQRLLLVLHEVLAPRLAGELLNVFVDALQAAVLLQQLPRIDRPDQRHAGHVVRRVADHSEKIDDLVRRDSPNLAERLAIEDLVFADVVELHPIGNQLPAILVAGHQQAVSVELLDDPGERGQEVVRLERRQPQTGNPQRLNDPMAGDDLRGKVVGHGGAIRLVLRVHRVAKRFARHVERAKREIRPLRFQQVQQVPREAVHRRHGLAARTGHLRQGMKDLVDQRVGVDDPNRLPRQAFRLRPGRPPAPLEHRRNRRGGLGGRRHGTCRRRRRGAASFWLRLESGQHRCGRRTALCHMKTLAKTRVLGIVAEPGFSAPMPARSASEGKRRPSVPRWRFGLVCGFPTTPDKGCNLRHGRPIFGRRQAAPCTPRQTSVWFFLLPFSRRR